MCSPIPLIRTLLHGSTAIPQSAPRSSIPRRDPGVIGEGRRGTDQGHEAQHRSFFTDSAYSAQARNNARSVIRTIVSSTGSSPQQTSEEPEDPQADLGNQLARMVADLVDDNEETESHQVREDLGAGAAVGEGPSNQEVRQSAVRAVEEVVRRRQERSGIQRHQELVAEQLAGLELRHRPAVLSAKHSSTATGLGHRHLGIAQRRLERPPPQQPQQRQGPPQHRQQTRAQLPPHEQAGVSRTAPTAPTAPHSTAGGRSTSLQQQPGDRSAPIFNPPRRSRTAFSSAESAFDASPEMRPDELMNRPAPTYAPGELPRSTPVIANDAVNVSSRNPRNKNYLRAENDIELMEVSPWTDRAEASPAEGAVQAPRRRSGDAIDPRVLAIVPLQVSPRPNRLRSERTPSVESPPKQHQTQTPRQSGSNPIDPRVLTIVPSQVSARSTRPRQDRTPSAEPPSEGPRARTSKVDSQQVTPDTPRIRGILNISKAQIDATSRSAGSSPKSRRGSRVRPSPPALTQQRLSSLAEEGDHNATSNEIPGWVAETADWSSGGRGTLFTGDEW
ncbi:MAG: hypothetical protein M1828_002389 [Chrysothrix sp. TS-e1954]|nr:MAG: hypothetical protein M1828_002389 [Chrysothrix sp. TS-e1954]